MLFLSAEGQQMIDKTIQHIMNDKKYRRLLQCYYNAYTAECEVLRAEYGNADFVSDKWTEKAHHCLVDFMFDLEDEEIKDYYLEREDDDFMTELDRQLIDQHLSLDCPLA